MSEEKEKGIILTSQSKKELGECIICKVGLNRLYDTDETREEKPDHFILQCPKCDKFYFPKYEIIKHKEEFGSIHQDINDQLETEGIGVFEDSILMSDNKDYTGFPEKEKTGHDYIKKVLGHHVEIMDYKET